MLHYILYAALFALGALADHYLEAKIRSYVAAVEKKGVAVEEAIKK